MRYFEKISFEQFKKDISDNKKLYDEYVLPSRGTKFAAGYDFKALFDYSLEPGEIKKYLLELNVIWKVMRYYIFLIEVVWALNIMFECVIK